MGEPCCGNGEVPDSLLPAKGDPPGQEHELPLSQEMAACPFRAYIAAASISCRIRVYGLRQ